MSRLTIPLPLCPPGYLPLVANHRCGHPAEGYIYNPEQVAAEDQPSDREQQTALVAGRNCPKCGPTAADLARMERQFLRQFPEALREKGAVVCSCGTTVREIHAVLMQREAGYACCWSCFDAARHSDERRAA